MSSNEIQNAGYQPYGNQPPPAYSPQPAVVQAQPVVIVNDYHHGHHHHHHGLLHRLFHRRHCRRHHHCHDHC
ncbi:hypothetical protein Q1695_008047 [Nippostrongylus brasiliensis]|nr:hypothetical protein Q1695_008047 [Nippostrongylus brasiliensis]